MRDKNRQNTGTVKVYRFLLYDIVSEDFKISARMATHACIRRIHAKLIRRTELEIDKKDLNTDGMTEIGFVDRELSRM
jgi:predicted RNA-binding protein